MSIKEILDSNEELHVENFLYHHKNVNHRNLFEKLYLELRRKEGRIYNDEVVKKLPEISQDDAHATEWTIRSTSLHWLISHLNKNTHLNKILEVGCGNGWLSNNLMRALRAEICGIDVNETELNQAARLFQSDRLSFVKADIMNPIFPVGTFDAIILASSIQYFSCLHLLIEKLHDLLTERGEIHILDSPIYYSGEECSQAQNRSNRYFASLGLEKMSDHYHYHTFNELTGFCPTVIFNPKAFSAVFKRNVFGIQLTPFPWIKIARINKINQT